ncbi:toll/interleukin-1 receptor domain-containing protein [Runella sp.]|uniref:toll/interleukin-1 receptor domain-containing protein n=1 Tax=Runella sp. TaxID=1960881 RepID=UPI003D0C3407
MAYIPGYTYDIFISYAHLDNMRMPGQEYGWIELFYQSLNIKLAQRVGKMNAVKIWWDTEKLNGTKLFDKSIEDGIQNSALFISLISPGYLQSEYCKKEMNLFYTKSSAEKTGISVGDTTRMIKVLLNNIPHTQLPNQFGRATGFPFYKSEDKDDLGDPLDYTDPTFTQQLKDLRDSLVHIFEMFPREQSKVSFITGSNLAVDDTLQPTAAPLDNPTPKNGLTLYFGEVSDSLRTARKRTMTELEKIGFSIITNIPPPDEVSAHEQKLLQILPKADLAIHLLDQFPGRDIDGTDTWYPKKQVELSLQLSPAKLLWVPSDLDENNIEEEKYKVFIQELEKHNKPENKFEFIRGNKNELTRQITDYAEAIKQYRARRESSAKISVLLDTHLSDQLYAFTLGEALLKNNMQPYINPEEDDPRKNINLLAQRISQVNKLVFLYGQVSKEWVLERMSAALQLIVTNNYAIDDFYVYMAPPNKMNNEIKLNQRFLKVNVVNNSANPDLNAEMLDAFIKKIKGGSAA